MELQESLVLWNRQETSHVFRLALAYDALARGARPARFVMLTLKNDSAQILPRPFSLSDVYRDGAGQPVLELLYKPVGHVTRRMTALGRGDLLLVGGLHGNGFPDPLPGRLPVLLAGGIGNAPFALLVRDLARRQEGDAPLLFLAGGSAPDLYIQEEARARCGCVVEVTEDGSQGESGLITEALLRRLPGLGPIHAFACGPTPMLRALQQLAQEHGFPCHLALEERMACGYGVCNACVVESCRKGGESAAPYRRLCLEGPVMEAREVHL